MFWSSGWRFYSFGTVWKYEFLHPLHGVHTVCTVYTCCKFTSLVSCRHMSVVCVCCLLFVVCVCVLFVCVCPCVCLCAIVIKHNHHCLTLSKHTSLLSPAGIRHTLKGQLLWTFLATSANLSECCWRGGQRTQCPRCPALLVPPSVRGRHCTETCRTNTRTHW